MSCCFIRGGGGGDCFIVYSVLCLRVSPVVSPKNFTKLILFLTNAHIGFAKTIATDQFILSNLVLHIFFSFTDEILISAVEYVVFL